LKIKKPIRHFIDQNNEQIAWLLTPAGLSLDHEKPIIFVVVHYYHLNTSCPRA
jgi:hypothetical protein